MTGMERLLAYYNTSPPDSMQSAVVRNILANIQRIGDLTIDDLEYLAQTSVAEVMSEIRTPADGSMLLSFRMETNELRMIMLQRI